MSEVNKNDLDKGNKVRPKNQISISLNSYYAEDGKK